MHFLAFEGLDGSGKSTLIRRLSADLTRRKLSFIVTREPGGTPFAELVRELILRVPIDSNQGESAAVEGPCARAEVLLYAASRAQHVEQTIRPALARGDWALCDRFTASTVAFQAGARGLERKSIDWLNAFAIDGIKPNLTILLDLPYDESLRRRRSRGDSSGVAADRLERESRDFHEAVRASYLEQAKADSSKWLVLDATKPVDTLAEKTLQHLDAAGWFR